MDKNIEKKPEQSGFWKGFALFLLGIIIGFFISPVKNGVEIGNNNNIEGNKTLTTQNDQDDDLDE